MSIKDIGQLCAMIDAQRIRRVLAGAFQAVEKNGSALSRCPARQRLPRTAHPAGGVQTVERAKRRALFGEQAVNTRVAELRAPALKALFQRSGVHIHAPLIAIGPDHQGYGVERARFQSRTRRHRQFIRAMDRAVIIAGQDIRSGVEDGVSGRVIGIVVQRVRKLVKGVVSRLRRSIRIKFKAAALADRAMKQAFRRRRRQKRAHRSGPCALAKDRHLVRVAAKPADVRLHPLQRGDLVMQSCIGGRIVCIRSNIAESAQTIGDGDQNNALIREASPW